MNTDILVPISFFIVILFALKLLLLHRGNKRRELHQTLRAALESGKTVSDEVLQRLVVAADPRQSDLRQGIMFSVITLVVIALSWLLPFDDSEGRQALLVISIIPAAMAITHFALWRFWYRP